jgi:hypothetical protein
MGLAFLAWPAIVLAAEPKRPTSELLELVPVDASVVLAVDDLRGQTHELLASPLVEEFLKLPAVKAWFRSEKYGELERARERIEAVLKVSLAEVRDRVLGDAVVFALRLPAEEPLDPSRARGLLLLKAAEPRLLAGLIEIANSMQTQNGEISEVVERVAGDTRYFVRKYPAGIGRLADEYVLFPDGTFAMSNASGSISELITRKTGRGGGTSPPPAPVSLAELPRFQALDRRLPDRAVARLFVDARRIAKLIATVPQPEKEEDRRNLAIVQRLVGAIRSAGAALVVTDRRLALHAAEVFDPEEFARIFGPAKAAPAPAATIPDRVPAGTLAVGSVDLNVAHAYRVLVRWVPEADRPRLASIETALSGILLGQDLRTRVLPALGPGVLAVVGAPRDEDSEAAPGGGRPGKWPFPTVVSVELGGDRDLAAYPDGPDGADHVSIAKAVDNALRTCLAVLCLDEKRAGGRGRIAESESSGVVIRTLEPPIPLAYAVDLEGRRLILGSSADAVGRYLECGSDPFAVTRFRDLRALAFPEARTFFCLDLLEAEAAARKHRARLVSMIAARDHRPAADVSGDLEQAIDLARLFDAFFVTNRVETQTSTVYQTLGLLGRWPGAKPAPTSRP